MREQLHLKMLPIIYQDKYLVAIDKPPGLLCHRSRIDVSATEFAVQKLRDQIGQPVFLTHRIDRPTSGVLLFALDSDTARQIARQFELRSIEKSYLAIVRGHPPDSGCWDEPLIERLDQTTDALAIQNKDAQTAITEFNTLKRWQIPYSAGKYPNSRYSLVRIKPLTGRRHQIRRHFNHMSHPIVGDTTHGDRRHNRLFREKLKVHRLLLIARSLTFRHPETRREIELEAKTGAEFDFAIEQLDRASLFE